MKYYIDPENPSSLYAYDSDGSQDHIIPETFVPATDDQVQAIQNPAPTQAQIIAAYESAAQTALDAVAVSWQYESVLSAASYANSTSAQFKAEALALIAWRDAVWAAAYALEAQILAGTAQLPATPAAFVAMLPQPPARPT